MKVSEKQFLRWVRAQLLSAIADEPDMDAGKKMFNLTIAIEKRLTALDKE